jgi:hypothetical protein
MGISNRFWSKSKVKPWGCLLSFWPEGSHESSLSSLVVGNLTHTLHNDTLIHWRHTLAAQEAGQKTAALKCGCLNRVVASKFLFLFNLENYSWWVCAELKPGYGNRGIIRVPVKSGKPTTQHVEVICLPGGSFSPFRFILVEEWFWGAIWVLTLELLLHCYFLQTLDARNASCPVHIQPRPLPPSHPSILLPHTAWRWKKQSVKCKIC